MSKILNIGLIGAGRIGRLHGDILARLPRAKLAAVAEINLSDDCKQWAQGLGVEKITANPDDVFADKSIDAVYICSSTETHADFIERAAKAGQHIFCEKPIHTDPVAIKSALAEVEKAGVKLHIGFVRRFDRNHKKVRDTVASGRLGKAHIVKVISRDPEMAPVEYMVDSGGIYMDMTIHDFDMARYLSGSEVIEVTAYGAIMINPAIAEQDDVDTTIVMLKFENGAIGVIENSRAARYGYDQRTEVHCDKGCVQVSNDLIDNSMISTAEGVFVEKPTWFFLERYHAAFATQSKDFIDCVANNTAEPVNGMDGLMAVYIAMAAKKSLKEGRSVKISEVM